MLVASIWKVWSISISEMGLVSASRNKHTLQHGSRVETAPCPLGTMSAASAVTMAKAVNLSREGSNILTYAQKAFTVSVCMCHRSQHRSSPACLAASHSGDDPSTTHFHARAMVPANNVCRTRTTAETENAASVKVKVTTSPVWVLTSNSLW